MNNSEALAKAAATPAIDAVATTVGSVVGIGIMLVGASVIGMATAFGLFVLGRKMVNWINAAAAEDHQKRLHTAQE